MKVSRMTKIADVYYCLIYLITRMLKQKKKIKQKIVLMIQVSKHSYIKKTFIFPA
jgi:hypothetical protein